MPIPEPDQTLPERVRAALSDRDVREVNMFGGRSFMVDDRMVAAARADGDLLLRIDPADRPELMARPGAKVAMMGPTREMGDGWLAVSGDAVEGDALGEWLAYALRHHARSAD